ncbi:MAG: hypothetical protein Fur0034_18480 [Desulfuromonadia bacterium]
MKEKGIGPVVGSRIQELPPRDGGDRRSKKREKKGGDDREDRVSISRDARLLSMMEEVGKVSEEQ